MSQIEVYAFENADGESATDWTTQDIDEAKTYAREHKFKLIARIYEYADSELVEDNTDEELEGEDLDYDYPALDAHELFPG